MNIIKLASLKCIKKYLITVFCKVDQFCKFIGFFIFSFIPSVIASNKPFKTTNLGIHFNTYV